MTHPRSHPPRRRPAGPRLVAAVAALVAAPALVLGGPSPAGAASASSQSEYTCAAKNGLQPEAALLTVALDVPESAAPGEELSLQGTVTFALGTRNSAALALSLASQATVTSSSLALELDAGETNRQLRISDLESAPAGTRGTYTATARIELPSFVVPSDASDVRLALPSKAVVANPVGTNPGNVAFAATVTPQGGLPLTRELGCWLPDGTAATTVARIPVRSSSAGAGPSSSGGASTTSGVAAVADVLAGADAALLAAEGSGAVATSPGEVPVAAAAGTGTDVATASADVPPQTRVGGVLLPDWLLVGLAVTLPLVAVAFAVLSRRRLVRLTTTGGLR